MHHCDPQRRVNSCAHNSLIAAAKLVALTDAVLAPVRPVHSVFKQCQRVGVTHELQMQSSNSALVELNSFLNCTPDKSEGRTTRCPMNNGEKK